MTSHELRNPLSAVVQCADSVIASLQQLPITQIAISANDSEVFRTQEEVATCIDSLHTIVSCSLHQKRVIDDVLTLSKLDSNLILITPMRVKPSTVVSDAIKMFDIECGQAGIKLLFCEDETIKGMEWVMLDPSRLLQILINLLTNAIKFTKDRPKRKITVTLGGSWDRPPQCWQGITFSDADGLNTEILDKGDWGRGHKAYLWLKVKDTGCGMTTNEQKKLFSRFSQASPRTHVKYGGSGLGLFISKSLSALQGGAIGVHSEKGAGSTFAFYISTRLATRPADQVASHAGLLRPMPQRAGSTEDAMNNIKLDVLIVEDNLVNQKVLRKQLQKFGWNISVAGNGQEALDWLRDSVYWRADEKNKGQDSNSEGTASHVARERKHKVDIILMDIEMPIMDGLTCARMIRNYEDKGLLTPSLRPPITKITPASEPSVTAFTSSGEHGAYLGGAEQRRYRLPILAVSANARTEQVEQALAAGMDDAISKPFRIPELWPKMRGLIRRIPEHAGEL